MRFTEVASKIKINIEPISGSIHSTHNRYELLCNTQNPCRRWLHRRGRMRIADGDRVCASDWVSESPSCIRRERERERRASCGFNVNVGKQKGNKRSVSLVNMCVNTTASLRAACLPTVCVLVFVRWKDIKFYIHSIECGFGRWTIHAIHRKRDRESHSSHTCIDGCVRGLHIIQCFTIPYRIGTNTNSV